MKRFLLLILATLALDSHAFDAEEIDRLVNSAIQSKHFMGQVLVVKDGHVVYQKLHGKANLELNADHTTRSYFKIGSLTKQFTAAAILMLQERGKVRLQETIGAYLRDYPEPARSTVTLHHLLTHTSGIPNFTDFEHLKDLAPVKTSLPELVGHFSKKPLEFKPGSRFKYSNSGYIVLGLILESVTRETFASFIEKHLLAPAQISGTRMDDPKDIIIGRVNGYTKSLLGSYSNADIVHPSNAHAAGGVISSANDFVKWDQALREGKILSDSSTKLMNTGHANFPQLPGNRYGYGWIIGKSCKQDRAFHPGLYPGFSSYLGRYLNSDIAVVVLSNVEANAITLLGEAILRVAGGCRADSEPNVNFTF